MPRCGELVLDLTSWTVVTAFVPRVALQSFFLQDSASNNASSPSLKVVLPRVMGLGRAFAGERPPTQGHRESIVRGPFEAVLDADARV